MTEKAPKSNVTSRSNITTLEQIKHYARSEDRRNKPWYG